jgi:hypothetical protein
VKRSKFSLSHYRMFSGDLGQLLPCGLTEVLPGDTIQQASSVLVRFAPLVAPVMHPMHVRIHHFYVPNRLIWDDWENFITGGPDGNDSSVYPTITFSGGSGAAVGSLADYLGVPTGVDGLEVSALPFRAYAFIYNEYFRDQDLNTELTIDTTSGADSTTNTTLQNVNWERDYFTVARPWEQKGDAVTLPLGTTAPVLGIGTQGSATVAGSDYFDAAGNDFGLTESTPISGTIAVEHQSTGTIDANNPPYIRADLSNATAASVIDLREAFGLQRYKEARARYGSRYVEYLRYCGVKSSDARLDRPEYFGGGRQTIQFSEVLQTAEGSGTAVGELKGHGIGAMRSNRYRRFIEEHGWVVSLISIRPKTIYEDGLQRHWNRRTKEDFFQKELQHIGQQEILNKEIKAGHATPEGVFGYGDRYDEYRHAWSGIAGDFKGNLNHWHIANTYASDPSLNSDFVKCVPDASQIFASSSDDVVYFMVNHSIQARRAVSRSASASVF